ncbi:hypothetical protein FRC18_002003 [Serendipita sp. 400]|nr:hypothetical protein FRC18_002003 [Serendipita sp. 400]
MVTHHPSVQKRTSRYHPYTDTSINCSLHGAECPHGVIPAQEQSSASPGLMHVANSTPFPGSDTIYKQHFTEDASALNQLSWDPSAFPHQPPQPRPNPSQQAYPTTSTLRPSQADSSSCTLRLTNEKKGQFLGLSDVNQLLVLRAGDDEWAQSNMLTWVDSISAGKNRLKGPIVVSKKKPKSSQPGEMLLGCRICAFTSRSTNYEEIVDHIISRHREWQTGYPCVFADCLNSEPPFVRGPHDLCLHFSLFHNIPVNHDASEVLCCLTAPLLHKPVDHRNFCVLSIAPSPQVTYPYPCTLQEVIEHQRAVKCYGGTGEKKEYTTRWINAFYLSYGRLPMKILFKGTLKKDGSPRKKQGVEHVGCVICGEPGQDLEEIMPHIISNHIMSAGFACKTCPKVFYRRGDLGRHRKEDHDEVIDKSTEMDKFINWDA